MNMKKLLYVLLAALLLATLTACSAEDVEDNNAFDDYKDQEVEITDWTDNAKNTFYFEAVDSESITITGFSSTNYQPHTVKIPAYMDNRAVVGISDEAFANCAVIEKIEFPKASDYKGNVPAFTVADNAFRGCVALKSLSLPAYVTEIGENAFYECEAMTTLTFENGCSLTSIPANAFAECTSLTSVSIPAGIESIGDAAFFACSSLEKLTIADGVKAIGKQAFQNCVALKNIVAPATLTEVGVHAFAGCDAVEIASVPTWIIEPLNKTNLVSVTLVAGDSIPASAFKSCDKLETVTIACELSTIGESAFVGCKSLRHIEIPATVTSIGRSMFKNCSSLTEITIPEAATFIGASAFSGCSSLSEISIPAGVTAIGDQAFASCYALKKITVADGNSVYTSKDGSLYDADLTVLMQYAVGSDVIEFAIPETVTEIKASAFAGCTTLNKLVIPNSVTAIGKYAFDGCVNISDVTLPVSAVAAVAKDGLVNVVITEGTEIAAGAFENCVNLQSVTLIDTITSIGASAFAGCTSLTTILLPEGVTEIGASMFKGCAALTNISIPEGVTAIGADAFRGCAAMTGIAIPKNVASIGLGAFAECASLAEFTVAAENTAFAADGGSLYNKAVTEILQYAIGKTEVALALPATVKKIAESAFLGAIHLQDLTIPATVTEIGADAFKGCAGITHAVVPTWALGKFATDSLVSLTVTSGEEIGAGVLANSLLLESVLIPATVTSVDKTAFDGCVAITHADVPAHALVAIPKNALVSVTVNGGEEIPKAAFSGVATLESFSMSESITKISDEAFKDCVLLGNVVFHEGIVEIGEDAFYGCVAMTELNLPASLTKLGNTPFVRSTALAVIAVAEGNEAFKAIDNVLYTADGKALIQYSAAMKQYHFAIPAGVETICENAFYNATNLVSLEVGADVATVENGAFNGCNTLIEIKNLSELEIEAGARSHGNIANNGEKALINIYTATEGASKLSVVDGLILFTVEDQVLVMGYAGEGTSVKISANVTKIVGDALTGIEFTEIVFAGTQEAWEDLAKGKTWDGGCESYTVKCTDGDIVIAPEVEEEPAA